MKFSILVATYNQKIEDILFTLKSCINQDYDDYEIIVADDGSKDNHFEQIKDFFKKNKFQSYLLVDNEVNQGTVKNVISGLNVAKGLYGISIGSGDALYSEHILSDLNDFIMKTGYEMFFGLSRTYHEREGKIIFGDNNIPFDINSYLRNDYKKILRNLIMYGDHVCGATIVYKLSIYKEYLENIKNDVKYMEDIFQVKYLLDGNKMGVFFDYIIYYENASGISTNRKSNFEKLLNEDVSRFFSKMEKEYPNNRYLIKRKKINFLYKIDNLYKRTFFRIFVNPECLIYLGNHLVQKCRKCYKPSEFHKGFFEE